MTDSLKEMAAQLRRLVEGKASVVRSLPEFSELLKLHQGLNGLESAMGEAETPIGEFLGIETTQASSPVSRTGVSAVRPDEFVDRDALDAAKMYLKKHRDARSFQEIVGAIKSGGGKVEDEEKLKVQLGRSTLDIRKFGDDHYGSLDNYPEEKAKRTKGLRKKDDEKKNGKPAASDTPASN